MTYKNNNVLEFYKELPFNISGDLNLAIKQIKMNNPLDIYPFLKGLIPENKKIRIIDIGCGGGWLVNSLAYHLGDNIDVIGIDFNPNVIDYAKKVKLSLNVKSKFFVSDLFTFEVENKFDIIISLGVLHHTNHCIKAINHIMKYAKNNSHVFIGLYHKYGRRPFLDYFKNLVNMDENQLYNEYKKLHDINDEKKSFSWFRDQVLHPHETQHSFEEIIPIFEQNGFTIIRTSLNRFKKIKDYQDIIDKESDWYYYAKRKLANLEYFPGFFIVIGRR